MKSIDKIIEIPKEVEVNVEGNTLKVKGPKGEVERKLAYPHVSISISEGKISIKSDVKTRPFKRIINTFTTHIKNLIKGVQEPYIYKLKVCSGHFPMKVVQQEDNIIIDSFLGEKVPRKSKILPGVIAQIGEDTIILEGINKEDTAQSAANLEIATKIKNRDRRVFQDGLFIISGE